MCWTGASLCGPAMGHCDCAARIPKCYQHQSAPSEEVVLSQLPMQDPTRHLQNITQVSTLWLPPLCPSQVGLWSHLVWSHQICTSTPTPVDFLLPQGER
jgi:hypothetical protein